MNPLGQIFFRPVYDKDGVFKKTEVVGTIIALVIRKADGTEEVISDKEVLIKKKEPLTFKDVSTLRIGEKVTVHDEEVEVHRKFSVDGKVWVKYSTGRILEVSYFEVRK